MSATLDQIDDLEGLLKPGINRGGSKQPFLVLVEHIDNGMAGVALKINGQTVIVLEASLTCEERLYIFRRLALKAGIEFDE